MLEYENLNFLEEKVEKKYAVVSLDNANKTIGYQINLINNQLVDLLGITLRKSKDSFDILYDVTDKITLEKYLKAKTIQVGEFSKILLDIFRVINKTAEYSFSHTNFVMRPEYIYMDNNLGKIYLLYIPIEHSFSNSLVEQFKALVKKLIVDVVTFDNRENVSFITDILNLLKDEKFDLLKFKEFLESYYHGENYQSYRVETHDTKLESNKKNEAGKQLGPQTEMIMTTIKEPKKLENIDDSDRLQKQEKEKLKSTNKKGTILLIFKKLKNGKKYKLKKNCKETAILDFKKKEEEKINCNFHSLKNDIKKTKGEIVSGIPDSNISINDKFPYLTIDRDGTIKKIYINKDAFKIGRSAEHVDYVIENQAIGKEHAEIRKINSNYCLIDLGSQNGTFINNKRLESQEMYKIKENDVIKLANCRYIFRLN